MPVTQLRTIVDECDAPATAIGEARRRYGQIFHAMWRDPLPDAPWLWELLARLHLVAW